MKVSVISGDIVASTSLSDAERTLLEEKLQILFLELTNKYKVYSRIIKGDYIECVIPNPKHALRVALLIKSFVKSIPLIENASIKTDKRVKNFKTYGIRLAIGYGELSRFIPEKGIIDGEAIYLSGRTINETVSYNKKRIIIKHTLFFVSNNLSINKKIEPVIALLDILLSKATEKQCFILYLKLLNYSESEISKKIEITQSVINQHSTSVGWHAIEKAVTYFYETIKK